ncbi:Palmitoyl-protein_thioesterase [Hexamita inflata]|uniref:Palmitoyl-protein thioesterase n=1 Tax=Hexamita inflata TaxID=28002 RepID=A0AA86QGL4_9EUKA|nr:Palmitoyl-protein thioesterase [Hexamita inflata]
MHGFDDQMSSLVNQIQTLIPEIQIRNCEVGDGENATVFMTIENQVNELRTCILNDPKLSNGFIAFGYSNGGTGCLRLGFIWVENVERAVEGEEDQHWVDSFAVRQRGLCKGDAGLMDYYGVTSLQQIKKHLKLFLYSN